MSNNLEEIGIIINQRNLNTTSSNEISPTVISNDKTKENNTMITNLNDDYDSNMNVQFVLTQFLKNSYI